jgi:hypothetical protein
MAFLKRTGRRKGIEIFMIKNVKAPIGDFRNWDAITTWTETIIGAIKTTA